MPNENETPIVCRECGEPITEANRSRDDAMEAHQVCGMCSEHWRECRSCREVMREDSEHWEDGNSGECRDCIPEDSAPHELLNSQAGSRYGSDTQGDIVKSPRTFGVELETTYTDQDDAEQCAHKISSVAPIWGIHSDGSINYEDHAGAAEIVSPPLYGKDGEQSVMETCTRLRAAGFAVNESCGYHLHLDAPEYRPNIREDITDPTLTHLPRVSTTRTPTPSAHTDGRRNYGKAAQLLKTLFIAAIRFEPLFFALVHKKRWRNRYCAPLADAYPVDKILVLDDYYALERLWYDESTPTSVEYIKRNGKMHNSRYRAINLHALMRYGGGTYEIRLHGGTLNYKKILHWVQLHASLLDAIADGRLTLGWILQKIDRTMPPEKLLNTLAPFIGAETTAFLHARLTRLSATR